MKRSTPFRLPTACAALAALLAAPAAIAQPPMELESPLVCPAIEEDGDLCSDDPQSENCAGFVAATGVLGGMYRSRVQTHPEEEAGLLAAIWWGCGTATLSDVKMLLLRIGSPAARALLDVEPYRSVPPYTPAADASAAPMRRNCYDLTSASSRVSCVSGELDEATAAHQKLYESCMQSVAPGLREDFVEGETTWKATRGLSCASDAPNAADASYQQMECLTKATLERNRAMLRAHPECAPGS